MSSVLDPKVVLVTGASSGIGRATALALSKAGATVAVGGRRTDRLEALAQEAPGEILVLDMDVSDPESVRKAVDRTVERFGTLDIVVNNAGIMLTGPVLDANPAEWSRMVETNLLGSMYTVHAALPHMLRSRGAVVQISSTSGRISSAGAAVYCATKFGVNAFAEALRQEVTERGGPRRRRGAGLRVDRVGRPHHGPRRACRGQDHGRVDADPSAGRHRGRGGLRRHTARPRRGQRDPCAPHRPVPLIAPDHPRGGNHHPAPLLAAEYRHAGRHSRVSRTV
ncbi:SDR family oxidoreductase [Streptomyces arenae]|uniref:SDR family oxidoreductase n=1 Tax=Streptomyces arenae TaxID=29301 RepID=UPI002659ADA8|nr:SDR family NAD(P)-dependent oxidoreductase [Streptomyces arenae]MCG7206666.1 SDR family NAD(P)-dependent oxidoreductase [Streptomyces arenae]